ncbi:kinase-like protein, partial [Nemania abortiva]
MSDPRVRLVPFSLKPLNDGARKVAINPRNYKLARQKADEWYIDIGLVRSSNGDNNTLATLGRGDADVIITPRTISRIQCSFEIDPITGIIMFYDRSHNLSSQVFGENATPFIHGRPRKVVVQNNCNTIIGMGGVNRDLIQFELCWHDDETLRAMEKAKCRDEAGFEQWSHLALTVDDADTALPSERETRIHTPGPQPSVIRFAKIDELGSGQFGEVIKAVDIYTGKLMAVKLLKRPAGQPDQQWRSELYRGLKREVEIFSGLNHEHIVNYIGSQVRDIGQPAIFMGLKEGSLAALVRRSCSEDIPDLGWTALCHMLRALDYLATKNIVHRDVKPDNILFETRPDGYHFQLGDFGLSNNQNIARTIAGSLLFMAPEFFSNEVQLKTHKVDVWSLYVTILWTLDLGQLRTDPNKPIELAREAILQIAKGQSNVSGLTEMARSDPEERASAAQMLVKLYNAEGLSTPILHVPPLNPVRVPVTAVPTPRAPRSNRGTSRRGRRGPAPSKPCGVRKPSNSRTQPRNRQRPSELPREMDLT